MDNLFASKKSVNPEILLATETIHMPVEEEVVGLQENIDPLQSCEKTIETVVRTPKRKLTIAEKMRCDRKAYQEERLLIEMEKLEVLKMRNELIKERNKILSEKGCCCKCITDE
ncbi:hypothetical protein C0J52_13816 [Blattella germanica]|nr:hypothetical protein C0J52_13816 [Blattella germanica]